MSEHCTTSSGSSADCAASTIVSRSSEPAAIPDSTVKTLLEIARRFGTPTYAYDIACMRRQVDKLASSLPASVGIFYSLKANASLGISEVFADCGLGADVASAGELATAIAAGFPADRIFVAGPFKMPETIDQLSELPEALISVDSASELRMLSERRVRNPIVLRLRPDFGSAAVVTAGHDSRFGFTFDALEEIRLLVSSGLLELCGFHVFAGSQVLEASGVVTHLKGAYDLSMRAANVLGIVPSVINLGGGFGTAYGPRHQPLDLQPIGELLQRLVQESPARLMLELGRYLIAEAGWYLTTVLGHQTFQGRAAVVVDGGSHQRADLCGLSLRTKAYAPAVLRSNAGKSMPIDVLGCLSLPADVLCESSMLPELAPGDLLAFRNAGAYGWWSSPVLFHGSPLPAEVAFNGSSLYPMRRRAAPQSILADQLHVVQRRSSVLA